MTIEDRVDDIGDWRNPDARNHAIQVMRAAVKAAVEEEREACAKICDPPDRLNEVIQTVLRDRAAAIRARSEK